MNKQSPFFVDDLSGITVSYCLSNNHILPGPTNILGDPLFVNADSLDFHLLAGSPCIDTGDPVGTPDSDGSRADIGAYPYGGTIDHVKQGSTSRLVVYPNPVHGQIQIQTGTKGNYKIFISSMSGQMIYSSSFFGNSCRLDVSFLPEGAYLLTIKSTDFVSVTKIIKHK